MRRFILLLSLTAPGMLFPHWAGAFFDIPPPAPASQYGNILINRTSEKNNVKPVTFSHWSHRLEYTCKVCHLELEINMKLNTTEITEEANKAGKFCGACHNGDIAFDHSEANCDKCHNGDIHFGKKKFAKTHRLPKTKFGNRVDWVRSVEDGLIAPKSFLREETPSMTFNQTLELRAEWAGIPHAVFPHKAHVAWLDCSNCHPDIFNIKKKTTKHFTMTKTLRGEFCGVCHLSIAFPMNDCRRCHPTMVKD